MIPLGHVFKELFTERTRVLLTILAIAWGTASITTMLALGEGLRLTFSRSGKGMGESILVVWPGQTSKPYGGLPEGHPVPLSEEDLNQVRASIPEIGWISGEHRNYSGMRYGDNLRTGRMMGVHPDYGLMRNIILESGSRFIDPIDIQQRRRVAVVGPQVAEELFGEGVDPVGRQIEIDGRPFLVVGLMKKKYQMSTYGGPDRDGTWIPISTFETLYNRRHYGTMVVKPRDRSDIEYVEMRIREVIAGRHGCDPTDEEITNNWNTKEQEDVAIGILYGLQVMLGIIGGLTLIVAGVGIANVMYVSVSNATRDIGIRMAVGARQGDIMQQFLIEALGATAIGGFLGIFASQLVVWIVEQVPMDGEFFEFVGRPVPVLSLQVALIVVAVLGIIGFLAGFFPARKAAQVDPAEALRYE